MVYDGIQGIVDSGGAVLQRFLLPVPAAFEDIKLGTGVLWMHGITWVNPVGKQTSSFSKHLRIYNNAVWMIPQSIQISKNMQQQDTQLFPKSMSKPLGHVPWTVSYGQKSHCSHRDFIYCCLSLALILSQMGNLLCMLTLLCLLTVPGNEYTLLVLIR